MIGHDEDALICDMAETYHIYRFDDFDAGYIATLAAGLRDNARAFYDEMEKSIVISRCPFHYVAELRRRRSDRTWRFRLARLALNVRTFLAAR